MNSQPSNDVITIVSGPTSVGKSTYLQTKNITPDSVLYAFQIDTDQLNLSQYDFFHYNLYRPADVDTPADKPPLSSGPYVFSRDKQWLFFNNATRSRPFTAEVLVVSRRELIRRTNDRLTLESGYPENYPVEKWSDLHRRIDLERLYSEWFLELEQRNIPFQCIDARSRKYPTVSTGEALSIISG